VIKRTDFPCAFVELQQRFGDGAAGALCPSLRVKAYRLISKSDKKSKLVGDE
jgi:hypothetical protein